MKYSAEDVRHAEYLAIESFGDFEALAVALIAVVPAETRILKTAKQGREGVPNSFE